VPTTNPKPVHGIYQTRTAEWRRERGRNAGKIAQSPETYAKNLVRNWPELSPETRQTIRTLLRPVIGDSQ
jgi:hypothetical protein